MSKISFFLPNVARILVVLPALPLLDPRGVDVRAASFGGCKRKREHILENRASINDSAGFAALLGGTALTAPLADAGPQLVPPVEANGLSGRIGVRLPCLFKVFVG